MSTALLDPAPRFYKWTFPGAPILIRLNLETVRWMQAQFEVPDGNASNFGLLLGDARPGVTEILNCQPLDSGAVPAVQAAIQTAKQVVGFYRITGEGGISMSQEDMELAESLFPDPGCVFLLIERLKTRLGDAKFCFWGEGQLYDLPIMVFPYDVNQLESVERIRLTQRASAPAGPDALAAVPRPTLVPFPAQPSNPASQRARRLPGAAVSRLAAFVALVVVVTALAGALLWTRRSSEPHKTPPVTAGLGLVAERIGGSLVLSWSSNSPQVQNATSGKLLIREGALERAIPLAAEQLRVGKLVYAADPEHAEFQLVVEAGGRVSRESLTVLVRNPAIDSRPTNQRPLEFAGVLIVNVPAAPPAVTVPAAAPKVKAFKPLPRRPSVAAARIEDAPQALLSPLAVTGQPGTAAGGALASILGPPGLPRPVLPATERPDSAVASAATGRPPVPINRTLPQVSAQTRSMLAAPVTVSVKVSIDSHGDVIRAEAVPKPGLHPLLRDAATQAARRWKFQPALLNDQTVPAEIVLQFNFAPTDRPNRL